MNDIIKHSGIVENIEGPHVRVRIIQTSACSTCSAKQLCNSSESKEKLVDIYTRDANDYFQGQEVEIYGTTTMGMKAVWWGFGVPFLILVIALFLSFALTDGNEPLSGLIALLSVVPYYLILYIFRNRMQKNFSFTLKPINN